MRFVLLPILATILMVSQAVADLRVLTCEEPPTNYMHDGQLMGTTTDVVYEIMRRVENTSSIEFLPGARMVQIATLSPDVVMFTAGKTPERVAHGFSFLGPVITRQHALYMRSDASYELKSLEDVKGQRLTVAGMLGDWRTDYFRKQGVRLDVSTRHEFNLRKLLEGRVDLMVSSDIEMMSMLKKMSLPASQVRKAHVFMEAPSFIAFSKGTDAGTVALWTGAFRAMQQTGFFNDVAAKYQWLLGIDFEYAPDKGFYVK